MSVHAGFAAVVAVDQKAIETAVRSVRRSKSTINQDRLSSSFVGVGFDVYVDVPRIEIVEGKVLARIRVWGDVEVVTAGVSERRFVEANFVFAGSASVTISAVPQAAEGTVDGEAGSVMAKVSFDGWQNEAQSIRVVSGLPFSEGAFAKLNEQAKEHFTIPELGGEVPIDFLGGLATQPSLRPTVVHRSGGLLVGFDITTDELISNGDPNKLVAFPEDIAVVIHPDAIPVAFSGIREGISKRAADDDASLENFQIGIADGSVQCSGTVAKTGGHVDFSFVLKPNISDRYFWFSAESITTSGHLSWWADLVSVATLGFAYMVFSSSLSWAQWSLRTGLGAVRKGSLFRRSTVVITPDGGPIMIGIESTTVTSGGLQFAVSFQPVFPGSSVELKRPVSVDSNGEIAVHLPWDDDIRRFQPTAGESEWADPLLRVRWTLRRTDTGRVVFEEDGPASHRLSRVIAPTELPLVETDSYQMQVRVYRVLPPFEGEILNETRPVKVVDFVDRSHPYVHWTHYVQLPVVKKLPNGGRLVDGQLWRKRESVIHRTHPFERCRMLRFVALRQPGVLSTHSPNRPPDVVTYLDTLPFTADEIMERRGELCDYCFFGGPDKTVLRDLP